MPGGQRDKEGESFATPGAGTGPGSDNFARHWAALSGLPQVSYNSMIRRRVLVVGGFSSSALRTPYAPSNSASASSKRWSFVKHAPYLGSSVSGLQETRGPNPFCQLDGPKKQGFRRVRLARVTKRRRQVPERIDHVGGIVHSPLVGGSYRLASPPATDPAPVKVRTGTPWLRDATMGGTTGDAKGAAIAPRIRSRSHLRCP